MEYGSKTNWQRNEVVTEEDFNRIEKSVKDAFGRSKANEIKIDEVETRVSNKMDIEGGEFKGVTKAQSNTFYTIGQVRNIILSSEDADVNAMKNGEIWIKYK